MLLDEVKNGFSVVSPLFLSRFLHPEFEYRQFNIFVDLIFTRDMVTL